MMHLRANESKNDEETLCLWTSESFCEVSHLDDWRESALHDVSMQQKTTLLSRLLTFASLSLE